MESCTRFNDLPLELKFYILSYFDCQELNCNVAKVCKRWRHLSTDPSLWRKLKFHKVHSTPEQMIKVINRNQFIYHIDVTEFHTFDWLQYIEKHTSVRSIYFHYCRFSELMALRLVEIFPNIEKVKIAHCENFEFSKFIMQITNWKFLKSFKICGSKYTSLSYYIPLFVERCNKLEKLSLGDCHIVNSETLTEVLKSRGKYLKLLRLSFAILNNETCQLLTTTCDNLTELRIEGPLIFECQHLKILTKLPILQILQLRVFGTFFTANFQPEFENVKFPNLTELIIIDCHNFDDKCLKTFVNCCPRLTDLHVKHMSITSEADLITLPTICPNLELLILGYVDKITKKSVEEIVAQLPKLRYCVTVGCPQINDIGFWRLVDNPRYRMCLKRNFTAWQRP